MERKVGKDTDVVKGTCLLIGWKLAKAGVPVEEVLAGVIDKHQREDVKKHARGVLEKSDIEKIEEFVENEM